MAKFELNEEVVTPSPPPAGALQLYAKTDDVMYIQNSAGVETPIGTPNAITDLTGDVSATGPGSVVATVNSVGGKTAAEIATSVNDTQAATSLNVPNTIVKRDGSGNIFAGNLSGSNTGDVTLTAVGSSPNANGASLSGQILTLQPANGTNPGVLTAIAQTIGGIKTFLAQLLISDTTQSTDKDSGSIITEGGLGVEKNINAGGNIAATGTLSGSNFSGSSSGTNTGDVTVTDTNSIDLTLAGQNVSAALKLSADAADAGYVKANSTIHTDGLHVETAYGTPVQIGTANFDGAAPSFALSDHVHNHGSQTSPTLHALATTIAHGFMSSTDKTKIDNELPASLGTANQVLGVNAAATAAEYKSVLGTTNQVNVTHGVGSITLSTPQNIHTGATPTFAGENLTDRLEFTQSSAPATPAATKADVYLDNSNGFSRLRYLDATGSTQTILRDTIFVVNNNSGSTITKGQAVYVTGSTGTNITIGLAQANSSNTVPVLGLAYDTITNGAFGRVISIGIITGVDTSAFVTGQRVYLSPTTPGALTATKPVSPNIWQRIGVIINANVSGSIEVRPLATHGEESGTNTGFTLNSVALTDAATIATDASLGNTFSVTLGGNRTLGAPTNPTDGQKLVYRIRQDGTGNRTLAFNAIFRFGLDIISFVPSTGANKLDYIGFIYNGADSKWDCVAVSKGFN